MLDYATAQVREIPGARIIGEARHKTGVLSFVLDGVHPHDAGTILDQRGHRGPHRPALRAAGDGPLRHHRDDSRLARRSTTRARTSTRWSRALDKVREVFALMSDLTDLYQEVILDHNRRPRNFRAIEAPSHTPRATIRSAATG